MLKITSVTTDFMIDPAGITAPPQIGWVLASDRENTFQSSYRLLLSVGGDTVYDSGTVQSAESAHIVPEIRLRDVTSYEISVIVTDCHGETAAGSGSFLTGFRDPLSWQGTFITAEREEDRNESFSTLLRKDFSVASGIREAYFIGSAHGLYNAYLNGRKIGDDWLAPGWTSYNKRLQYQVYPVTSLLCEGKNALCIELGAGWYKGKMSFNLNRNHYGTRTAFGGQILIRYKDGTEEHIVSDRSWKGARGPVLFSEIYDGETCDMRLDPLRGGDPGSDAAGWTPVEETEQDVSLLVPQQGPGVQIAETLQPLSCFLTPAGERVVDFGQNLAGWCRLSVNDSSPGDIFRIQLFETLDADGNVYTANLRTAKQTYTYVSRGGAFCCHPLFTFQGFRYAHVLDWPGEPSAANFSALVLHSHLRPTGDFSCSSDLVNRLHTNIRWSMKGNFVDIPTDCPQRDERLGWTGDAQVFNGTAMLLANCHAFFSKWLQDVAADQTPDGAVPHVVPDIISSKSANDWLMQQGTVGASAWADVAVILPWNLYLTYGDKAVLVRQYDSMKRWIDFMTAHSTEGCLFSYALQFGDWVALDAEEGSYFGATPTAYTCAAYYCYSTSLFAKIAGILGREEDALAYSTLAKELRSSFALHFLRADGHLTVRTQTAQIVALEFDLLPQQSRAAVASDLAALLRENGGHLVTGFIGTPYFCHALSSNGYPEDAYRLLLNEDYPGWLYPVKKGATTMWEHWDGLKPDGTMWSPDMNSFNHYAYGSVGCWLYQEACGIRPDEQAPGYRHFFLRPLVGTALSYARASFESIYGKIESFWTREGNTVTYRFTVPVNTTATVILEQAASITETDVPLMRALSGSGFTAEFPSGSYRIIFQLQQ